MIQLLLFYALKASLLLALAAAAVRLCGPGPAATRHLIWTSGLAAAAAMLPLSMAMPQLHLDFVPASRAGPGLNLLVFLWLIPACLLLARVGAAQFALARLRRGAVRIHDLTMIEAAAEAASAMGLRRRVELREAPERMPLTFGIFRPTVLLPKGAESWPRERLRLTLLHEMAHVARRDPAALALAGTARALLWFNPLAWTACRAVASEAEHACDDRVLAAGASPAPYARTLIETVRDGWAGEPVPSGAIGMASGAEIEARMKAILSPRPGNRYVPILPPAILQAAAIAAMLCLAPLRAEASPARLWKAGTAAYADLAVSPVLTFPA